MNNDTKTTGKLLTDRERGMLREYSAMMHRVGKTYWNTQYQEARTVSKWERFPQTNRLSENTRNLMITLATDPFLADIESGTAYQRNGRSGWASRLWPNQRWMLPSPFYGGRFLTQRILYPPNAKFDRQEWLVQRNPRVVTLTLQHAEFDTPGKVSYRTITRVLAELTRRWNAILPTIFAHFGLGGIVSWDLAVHRRGRSVPRLEIHLHAVIERYFLVGKQQRGGQNLLDLIKTAWASSARGKQLCGVHIGEDGISPEDVMRQINYAAGVTRIGNRLYPKFMRGFDSENPKSEKPTPSQLILIHAAYMFEPVFESRWFGLWDLRRHAIRDFNGRSRNELLVNSVEARQFLGVEPKVQS